MTQTATQDIAQMNPAVMAHPDPLGVAGFEFVEFAAKDASVLHNLFKIMGFTAIAKHKSLNITRYRQGEIDFLINEEADSFAARFAEKHGPCCTGFSLRINDRAEAIDYVLERGAKLIDDKAGTPLDVPMIEGIGGSILYITDRKDGNLLDEAFVAIEGVDQNPTGYGLTFVDHLTHNVIDGNMADWADYYTNLFNFYQVKYFDIKGAQTGLRSQAMTAPSGKISIPINESSDPKSQINEYINEYNGEGVQHIALFSDDIYQTIEDMRANGVTFMDTPDTYYEVVQERIPDHEEDIARMQKNKILMDADVNNHKMKLLQIFTNTEIGPIFFEVIQRKGNKGFGEGNFQALFESIERDQLRRGVL